MITLNLKYNHPNDEKQTLWTLLDDFTFIGVTVPKGFETDGTTVPRIFWPFVSPTGRTMPAAIVHDYMLSKLSAGQSRKIPDDKFFGGMTELQIFAPKKYTLFFIVRSFGIMKILSQILTK